MNGKTLPTLMFGLACAGILAFFTLGQKMTWVGSTDVAMQFVVTDAETGVPIPKAVVEVWSNVHRFCDEGDQPEFTIQTDESGTATQINKHWMCYGSESVFEKTFAVQLPEWCFRAKAQDYTRSDLEFLGTEEHQESVQWGKPHSTMSVPIRLFKHRNAKAE
jgi:hypothetical protein